MCALKDENINIIRNGTYEFFSPQIEFKIDQQFHKSLLNVILTKLNAISLYPVSLLGTKDSSI